MAAGVARLSPNFAEWVTVEGEQVILSLQLARFLAKAVRDIEAGHAVADTIRYLAEPPMEQILTDTAPSLQTLLTALRDRSRRLAQYFAAKLRDATDAGMAFETALNSVAMLGYRAARAHSFHVLAQNTMHALESTFAEQPAVKNVLEWLLEVMCLMEITEQGRDWAGVLTEEHFHILDDRITVLLAKIRPECVALVDAFGWSDSQLNSTIGKFDGEVYEAIYDAVKCNPLNTSKKMVGWDSLSTVLDLDFLREGALSQRAMGEANSKL